MALSQRWTKKNDCNKTKRTIGAGKHSMKYVLVVFTGIKNKNKESVIKCWKVEEKATRSQRHQLGLLRNYYLWLADDTSTALTIQHIRFNVTRYLCPSDYSWNISKTSGLLRCVRYVPTCCSGSKKQVGVSSKRTGRYCLERLGYISLRVQIHARDTPKTREGCHPLHSYLHWNVHFFRDILH
jgi:hypothetical protein